jgi:hypothetical protein
MADITGTLRKVTLDGVTYDVFADSNVKAIPSRYENTAIPTSGRNMHKMMRRVQSREDVTLVANGAEQEALKSLAERRSDFPMSYQTAAGDVYRAQGWIEFARHDTEENRATVTMHPREEWEAFLVS